ncbi:hypothetical protein AKJ41_06245 [candidate division MSBL1 archaeon SCGC-AAA259O05]|uniref:Uroporphyrinogen decarboxylase (URO-D) domain-containing protein n=1 Tax=candidate division MSBL1 archaeon SCGC-AAA259O05 TaxID=1698271 RepID=A0A133UXQ7_9EURY|nr:hypothetical protein AKJ41_06245 [candidate division MSBL1 archaeon SCGC-AAA259O05]
MNTRERFHKVFDYENVDRVPDFEFGYWKETLENWVNNGDIPSRILEEGSQGNINAKAERYFDFERRKQIPVEIDMKPKFQRKVIEENDRFQKVRNERGIICRELKSHETMPEWIEFPVQSYEDYENIKNRYDPSDSERYPDNWEKLAKKYRDRDYPLGIFCGSLYGWLRYWMGVERLSKKFARDPGFVDEMMTFLADHIYEIVNRTLKKTEEYGIQLDFSAWWEDMCYKKGPLISPRMFEKFMVPKYKRITNLLEKHGVHIHYVDSDGKIDQLVPLWLEGGINCMFPVEAAHTPPERIRKKFGKEVLMMGGVDKRALKEGKEAIDKELKKLKPLIEEGGFIPHVDHRVPADVSFENYKYYIKKKREIIGRN